MRRTNTIYIAGPMSKHKDTDWNYPAFHRAAAAWREYGWRVLNPAESFGGRTDLAYERYMRNALRLVIQAGAIALLPGWEESRGARMEVLVANRMGHEFYDAITGYQIDPPWADVAVFAPNNTGEPVKGDHNEFIQRLLPVAEELLRSSRHVGVTVTDLRVEATRRGLLTGKETRRQLSALGQVFRRCKAIANGTRRSELAVTHGIRQTVWYPY